MLKPCVIMVVLTLLMGCSESFNREATGIARCVDKKGYGFPTFEYDAKHPETSITTTNFRISKITYRDRLTNKLMTLDRGVWSYFECTRIARSEYSSQ